MNRNIFFPFLVLVLIVVGCNYPAWQSAINGEGMITYKISSPENNPYKNIRMLPGETHLVFKGTKASFITSAMGLIQIVNLLDHENKKYTSLLVNSIGENYAFTDTPEDVKEQESNPEYKIETTEEKR